MLHLHHIYIYIYIYTCVLPCRIPNIYVTLCTICVLPYLHQRYMLHYAPYICVLPDPILRSCYYIHLMCYALSYNKYICYFIKYNITIQYRFVVNQCPKLERFDMLSIFRGTAIDCRLYGFLMAHQHSFFSSHEISVVTSELCTSVPAISSNRRSAATANQ